MANVFIHDQTDDQLGVRTANAKLTVNCPSSSVVTAVSGNDRRVVVSDESNKAVFNSLTHGVWEITMSDGDRSASQSVDIITDYEITLDFFNAIIEIRYPSGSVCTCSNGVTTYTAPDKTGTWACSVPCDGIWTISCVDGELSKSIDVEITYNGQHVIKTINYFTAIIEVIYPNGAICSCMNESDIYSASDTSGNWSFTVHEPGEWTITATDNIQTVSETVTISYEGQVEHVVIEFFVSTINITYPAGATCTCTDGITNFRAPNTSGRWSVAVPRTGIWKITAFDDEHTTTRNVEITEDGQTVDITCDFFISYIDVVYPVETFKVVLWYINSYGNKVEVGVDTSGSGACRFIIKTAGEYEIGAYRVSPYPGIEETAGDYVSDKVTISNSGETQSIELNYNTIPEFTYSGDYKIVDDTGGVITETNSDWNIMFLTTGIFKATKLNGAKYGIDIFVLGGGGNGGNVLRTEAGGYKFSAAGGGGGGGYRRNAFDVKINENSLYEIKIGGAGGESSAFGVSASGGNNGGDGIDTSVNNGGGNGGNGGSSGGKGGVNALDPTAGEDGSYPFLGTSGVRYGPGGAGGYAYNGKAGMGGNPALGGRDGGGASGENAAANSGGGGGGSSRSASETIVPGTGGSGIVIIRNKR